MAELVEVAFRGNRKDFFTWDLQGVPIPRTAVIVEADRGEDLGTIHSAGELAAKRNAGCAHGCGPAGPIRKIIRVASKRDVRQRDTLLNANEDARRRALQKVREAGLQMKISDAEWQWDRKKLTLYFTADKRVDFRTLVRDLATMFRTRIELKQIGVRDEAKRLDGIGRCGRQYCSASWLPELRPVNLGVAKDQRLSLNPSQISGACGRLMCSLRYEHDFYVQTRKRFPKEGRIVLTTSGEAKVTAIDVFRETVTLLTAEGGQRIIPLDQFKAEIVDRPIPATLRDEESEETPPDEISPELMYTAEFAIPQQRLVILTESIEPEPAPSPPLSPPDTPAKRRRGRRGRGRGQDGRHSSGDNESA